MKTNSIVTIIIGGLLLGCATQKEAEVCAPDTDNIVGVGLVLGVTNHKVTIMDVVADSPASRAGLSPGLIVQEIDDIATDDKRLWKWVGMIRGAADTKVKLKLVDAITNRTNTVEIIREKILLEHCK